MMSSVISRLNDKRDAAAELGEDAGFTLIELMVVILILAILLAIAIPTFLGVTGGANDRAAQSNLNTALTVAKAAATQNNQTYTGVYAGLAAAEPSLKWSNDALVTTQGPVSVHVSLDGNGVVITSFSKNGPTCWYAVDNLAPVTDGAPYGAASATTFPNTAGAFYSKGTVSGGGCNPSVAPAGASWSSSFGG
ncbi:MAG: type II secretion system protein [Actinomycetes bacterium]